MDSEWAKELLEELRKAVGRIDVTLAAQHITLQEHQRRSLAAEEALATLRAEVKPISTHVAVVGALAKVLGAVGSLVAIALGVAKLLGH